MHFLKLNRKDYRVIPRIVWGSGQDAGRGGGRRCACVGGGERRCIWGGGIRRS